MIFFFNELDVKKGKQTCTCFYEQIDCACKANFPDYILGIYNVICILWFAKQDTTLWHIVKSRKIVISLEISPYIWRSAALQTMPTLLIFFFSVYIFKINCNVIRTSTPYLYYKFIVKCYYNKSLVSKKWLKIIVLELYNKCIVQ